MQPEYLLPGDEGATTSIEDQSTAGMLAFTEIAKLWGLTVAEKLDLLGLEERQKANLYNWQNNENLKLDRDKRERLSHILGIFKNIELLVPNEEEADSLVRRKLSAPIFEGMTVLEKMRRSIPDLLEVRRYFEGARSI